MGCCSGSDTGNSFDISNGQGDDGGPKYKRKRRGKGTINTSPGAPNNDTSIYKDIYSDIFDGDGVKTTPRFTVKINEDELQQRRQRFWGE